MQRYGYIFDAPFLWKKLKQISPDIIYQNIGTSFAGVAAYYAKRYRRKMVLHIASDNDIELFQLNQRKPLKAIIPYIEKKVFDYAVYNANKLIAQTHLQQDIILQNYGRAIDAVVHNFQPLPLEPIHKQGPVKIVWVANFKPLKQPELFIRLADDISKMNIAAKFIMVGQPASSANWQRQLEQRIGEVRQLSYFGGQTVEEVNMLLAESHIMVNTSLYEGFSNTFIQAWMRGVPVVSLNSNPEGLLDRKQMGCISGSYEQLCRDVLCLIRDDGLRSDMGNKAKNYARRYFSMENVSVIKKILMG
jgi:glycosyltransferase involved in cell wall biosynthesis